MHIKMIAALLLAWAWACPMLAHADEDGIIPGRFQVETSVAQDRDDSAGVRQRTWYTPTLLRFGLGDTLEARIETDGRMRSVTSTGNGTSSARQTENGYADLALGLKWHIADAEGARPSMAVLAHVDLDSGSSAFRATGKGGSLRLTSEWELNDDWGLGVMPGLAWQHDEQGARYTSAIFGIVLNRQLSERGSAFLSYSAPQIARGRHGGVSATVDVGGTWLLSNTVQLDTALSRGLNHNTPDWSWTAGLSLKF
jgi:hypothetical protein